MSIKDIINDGLQTNITASNAESSAMGMLNSWKALSNNSEWNNEACIVAGEAAINYSVQWKDAVIPAIEEEIEKYKAEYEEKKTHYESAEEMHKNAGKAVQSARKDMEACKDWERETPRGGNWQDTSMAAGTSSSKKVIVDHIGYTAAKGREAQALAEQNRYHAEMKTWEKQMSAAKDKMKAAEHKKKELEEKIESFILDVYSIKLMDECAEFLRSIKTSTLSLSENAKKTLFGRLFLLEHTYRKSFDKFQKIISSSSDKYTNTNFDVNPDSLNYSANRHITVEKFETDFTISCESKDSNSAELSYAGKKEFHISKAKAEAAQKDISSKCNAFTLSAERSTFTIELNKKYENDVIESELDNLNANSDSYAEECKTLLEAFKANGASSSKFRIMMDKLSNWHLNHWVKLWYKIVFILSVLIVLAGIGIGGYFGISAAVDKYKYNKSFTQWMVSNKAKSAGYHRYNFDDGSVRYFTISVRSDENSATDIKSFTENKTAEEFVAMNEEELDWYKNLISDSSFITPSSSAIVRITGNFRSKYARGEGYFKVHTDSEGKVTELSTASGLGDFYYSQYAREKYFSDEQ